VQEKDRQRPLETPTADAAAAMDDVPHFTLHESGNLPVSDLGAVLDRDDH
jgi:hypothetical protein